MLNSNKVRDTIFSNTIFISHATTDKNAIAIPLYEYLKKYNLNPWIDKEGVEYGDSIFNVINRALNNSEYAIVIISPAFVQNEWTNKELESIFTLAREKKIKQLFVVYHNIKREVVIEKYPLISDIRAFDSSEGAEYIAKKIAKIVLSKQELNALINGQKYNINIVDNLPTIEESFYIIKNLEPQVKEVKNPFLEETIKRLSKQEKEDMLRLLAFNIIQEDNQYAKLYEQIIERIPHRGSRENEISLRIIPYQVDITDGGKENEINLSLINKKVLTSLLETYALN